MPATQKTRKKFEPREPMREAFLDVLRCAAGPMKRVAIAGMAGFSPRSSRSKEVLAQLVAEGLVVKVKRMYQIAKREAA